MGCAKCPKKSKENFYKKALKTVDIIFQNTYNNKAFKKYCPLAQSVEHSAVNRSVVSSSLSGAAKQREPSNDGSFCLYCYPWTDEERSSDAFDGLV